MWEIDCSARDRPVPRAERSRLRWVDLGCRAGCAGARRWSAPRVPRTFGLDGLPEPRRGAEPVDPSRSAGGRSVHRPGRLTARCARTDARGSRTRADRRSRIGHLAVPAPAVRRDAAARRHRDGARKGPCAPHPRRADHRARRNGRGGGARPRLATTSGAPHFGAVHQPQPRRHLEDVLARRRALRGAARRGRAGRAPCCATRAIRTPSVSCAASRAAAFARITAASTRSRASCPALGCGHRGLRVRRSLRARRRALPRRRSRRSIAVEGGHASRCWYHERARDLPREEAADIELPPVARDGSPVVEIRELSKIFKQRGHEVHALTEVSAADLAG